MASRNALPLSTLFFIRDQNTIEVDDAAEPAVAKSDVATAKPVEPKAKQKQVDPVQAKLLALKLKDQIPVKRPDQKASTELVTKETANVVWRQFMISRAAMLMNQR
ncbi:uncharacterized protein IUM83_03968 [Phytophthora cinnamomi]|uniref:uncharacterized protein n=1 Tax=Phytophthora cinnamomi TaxID=4785 RepID=UPI002A3093B8|nr:hypothetical protein IUM83_03968 [Phytophthora cinnamomi]KAJ8571671.1 hypothetical protein ON010_g5162 [Phytophthora cinnamomi]